MKQDEKQQKVKEMQKQLEKDWKRKPSKIIDKDFVYKMPQTKKKS